MYTKRGENVVVNWLRRDAELAHLSDRELLAKTRELVDDRIRCSRCWRIWRRSMRAGCTAPEPARACTRTALQLRFSEDAAARRAGAAKLVKRFPLLLDATRTVSCT